MSESHPRPVARPRPGKPAWTHRAALPIPTLAVFAFFAVLLWLNAVVNPFRFNAAIAVLGTVPVLVLLARVALKARAAG